MKNNSKLVAIGLSVALCAGIGIQIVGQEASWYRPWTKAAQAARWARKKISDPIRTRIEKKFPNATRILEKVDSHITSEIPNWRYLPYEARITIVGIIMGAIGYIGYQKSKQLYNQYQQNQPIKPSVSNLPRVLYLKHPATVNDTLKILKSEGYHYELEKLPIPEIIDDYASGKISADGVHNALIIAIYDYIENVKKHIPEDKKAFAPNRNAWNMLVPQIVETITNNTPTYLE